MFESTKLLKAHSNVSKADICEAVEGNPPEGVGSDQERNLKSKSKRYPDQSDESRWNDIWRILFQGKAVPPTPCMLSIKITRKINAHRV